MTAVADADCRRENVYVKMRIEKCGCKKKMARKDEKINKVKISKAATGILLFYWNQSQLKSDVNRG